MLHGKPEDVDVGPLPVFTSLLIVRWFDVPLRGSLPLFMLLSPLLYYMDVILGIFLKGNGIADLWPQPLALALIGVVMFAIAAAVFRRQQP